jgi:hypothetical protein
VNATEQEVARLERRFGATWQIWVIYRAVGGVIWCARRWGAGDDATQTINASAPDELEEMLEAAEG